MTAPKKLRRKWPIRRILIAVALIVTPFVGATLAMLFHDGTLAVVLRLAARQVAGIKVEFRGPVSVQWQPSMRLVARNVWIAAKNDKEWSGVIQYVALTLENFRLSDNRLFLTNLTIDEADFKIQPAAWVVGRVGAASSPTDLSATPAMIESLDIEDVDILVVGPDNAPLQRVRIDEIRLDDVADAGPLKLRGRGEVDGRRGTLDGTLGSIDLVTAEDPYPVDVKLSLPSVELIIAGTIDDPLSGTGVNLALDLEVPDTSRLGLLFGGTGDVPLALTATGRLFGDVGHAELKELQLSAAGSGLDLLMSGSITNPRNLTGMALDITATLSQGAMLSSLVDLPAEVPFRNIAGKTRLTDDDGGLRFDDIELITGTEHGARLTGKGGARLQGPIDDATLETLTLNLTLQAPSLTALGPNLPSALSDLRDIEGSALLTGEGQSFGLKEIDIRSGGDGPVTAQLTSTIQDLTTLAKSGWPSARLTVKARDSQDLAKLAGQALPSLGPVKVAADLQIGDGAVDLANLEIGVGSDARTRIDATGEINGIGGEPERPFTSMDLRLKTAGKKFGWLKPYLPAGTAATLADRLTRVVGTARLAGDGATFGLTELDVQAQLGDAATATAAGRIGAVDPSLDRPVGDLRLDATLTAPDARSLGQILQIEMPDVGPLALTTTVQSRDRTGILDFKPLQLRLDRIELDFTGSLGNLLTDASPNLTGDISFLPDKLIAMAGGPAATGIGPARASIDLELADNKVVIRQATIHPAETPAIMVAGIGDIAIEAPFRHALTLEIAAPADAAQGLQGATGYFPQGGVRFDGTLAGDAQDTKLRGDWRSGSSEASVDVALSNQGARPRVAGALSIALLELADVENAFAAAEADPETTEPMPTNEGGPLFAEAALPFHWLDQVDVDIDVDINQIKGQRFSVETMTGKVRLADRLLSLADFLSYHAGGELRFNAEVDGRTDRPSVRITATGDDLDLAAILWQFDQEKHAKGALTLDFDLTASGQSPRQLAETLNGHFGAAIEEGRFRGSNLHLLSTERYQWLRAAARPGKTTKLRCVIARMAFEDGIGTTESLLLVTPKMKVSGAGRVDLHKEDMDITLAADRKTIAIIPAFEKPLRIHGPLTDPTVDASLTGHAADVGVAAGEAVLAGSAYLAAPFIFIPLRAAGYLATLLSEPDAKSACLAAKTPPPPTE